jgi:hypothetical protein
LHPIPSALHHRVSAATKATRTRQCGKRRGAVGVAALASCHLYSIPNGPHGPSPARARFGPTRCSPTLLGPMATSCRGVLGLVPIWWPRHGPMASFSGRAGTTARLAHRAGVGLSGSAGPFPALIRCQGRRPTTRVHGGAAAKSRLGGLAVAWREGGRDLGGGGGVARRRLHGRWPRQGGAATRAP